MHQRQQRLDPEHRTGQVDGQDSVPLLELDVGQAHATGHAGVVDQPVDAAMVLGDEVAQRLPGRRVGNVERMGMNAWSRRWSRWTAGGLERIGQVAGDHRRALGGQPRRLGLALPPGSPGDDDQLVLYAAAHRVTSPASTRIAWPVTAAAASEAR